VLALAVIGALIGAVSLTGSIIAWAKLDGRMDKRYTFPGQQWFNALVALAAIVCGVMALYTLAMPWIIAFFVLALALGVLMTLPIGGADMPVVISLYNAFTGLAVAFEGYVLGNEALIIAGMMVGAAGMLLTRLMAKAMNRKISNVLFSNFGGSGEAMQEIGGSDEADRGQRRGRDDGLRRARGDRARLRPGGGAGAAQDLGTEPAADGARGEGEVRDPPGRRPHARAHERAAGRGRRALRPDRRHGRHQPRVRQHRRVAGDRRQRRGQPGGQDRPGQPDLRHADPRRGEFEEHHRHQARQGHGFAGIENALFYADNTRMLYGDGAEMANALVSELKALDGGH
jgi:NAD(P) transhydrogenase subunit beta